MYHEGDGIITRLIFIIILSDSWEDGWVHCLLV